MKHEMMPVRQVTEGKLWNHLREYNINVVLVSISTFIKKKWLHIPQSPDSYMWTNMNIYIWYPHALIYSQPISKGFWVQTADLCLICAPLLAYSVNPTSFKIETLLKEVIHALDNNCYIYCRKWAYCKLTSL